MQSILEYMVLEMQSEKAEVPGCFNARPVIYKYTGNLKSTFLAKLHLLFNIKFMSDGSELYGVIGLESLLPTFQFNHINIHRSFVHSVVNINYLMALEHDK